MMKKCKNLVSAILLTACSLVTITGTAQNTTSTLPKNAKWVSVEYPTYGYTIRGYVYKKQFVEGQELEITQGELKITGVYKVENGTPIVRSKMMRSNGKTVEGGVFQVSNDVEGKQLIPHVKKARGLDVNLLDFSVYSGEYSLGVPLMIQKISDDNYEVSVNFPTRKIKSHISQAKTMLIIRSKRLTGEQGEIFYTNGDVYSGKIYDDGEIYLKGKIHVPDEGVTKFADGTEVKGDWLAKYNFPEKTWKEIYTNSKYKYPTEIRDLAIAKQKELEEQEKARLLSEQEKNKLKNYVDNYIKEHWVAPAPQGEFETTKEYYARVVKEKDKQRCELMHDALTKLYGNPFQEKIDLSLGQYNVTKGYFPMTTNGFGTYALCVSRSDGPDWRDAWDRKKGIFSLNYLYGLVDGKVRLVNLEAQIKNVSWTWETIYPIDEKTGKIYEFIWEDGVWKEKKEDEEDYEDEKIYEVVETMPSFNGNMSKWLRDKVKYPKLAQENGILGRVFVAFVVEVDGSITDVKIARSVDPSLDKEAVRVVKAMPKWNPGKLKGGKPVRVAFTVPINFTLSN